MAHLIKPEEVGIRYFNLKLKAAGGNGGANKGQKRTAEMKEKVRQANLGRKQSQEIIAKRVATRIGKKREPFSEEWKNKISIALTGKKHPTHVVEKRRLALLEAAAKGKMKRTFTQEQRENLRAKALTNHARRKSLANFEQNQP